MSREIKFRGKFIDTDEWIYGNLIGTDVIVGEIIEWDSEYFCTEFWQKVNPETVGQYTGLKDRNGKEIYEGDIVKGKRYVQHMGGHIRNIGEVVYASPSFRVNGVGQYKGIIHEELHSAYEVIGSIYENPELLVTP